MARLLTNGFELNSLTNAIDISGTNTSNGGTIAIDTTTKRHGGYSFHASNPGVSGLARCHWTFTAAASGPFFGRVYINIASLPTNTPTVVGIWDGTTLRSSLRITPAGVIQLFNSTTKVGSDGPTLSLNTWYCLELKYSNVGSGELEGKVDHVSFASASTGGSGTVDRISIGAVTNSTGFDFYFDDVALNDSTGSYQNSFPGAGSVIHLRPNAAGDSAQWTRSTGANNWANVDETTPSSSDFNQSRTTGEIDDYNIDDSGIGSGDTVNVVHVAYYGARNNSGTVGSAGVTRLKASSGGTVEEGSAETPSSTNYRANDMDTNNSLPYTLTSYVKPGTSDPWTQAALDTAQIGMRISSGSGDRFFNLAGIWLIVDYQPAAGGSPQTITPTGLASASALGSPSLVRGAVQLTPAGIGSGVGVGLPVLSAGIVLVAPASVGPGAAVGTPAISLGTVTLAPVGIGSQEAIGSPTLTPGVVELLPVGIEPGGGVGEPVVSAGGLVITPASIAPSSQVGTAELEPGAVEVSPAGLPSTAAVGSPTLSSIVRVEPVGIASTAALGVPLVQALIMLRPAGILSGALLGQPALTLGRIVILAEGIPSSASIGTPNVLGVVDVTTPPTVIPLKSSTTSIPNRSSGSVLTNHSNVTIMRIKGN